MSNEIIVPIDFSSDSVNALDHAFSLASILGARVEMIHVKQKQHLDPAFLEDTEELKINTVKGYFEILHKRFIDQYPQVKSDYKIREGSVYKEITNQAKYDDALLIIMGTHGASGIEEYWIGSNAYRVVKYSSCPVITIRYGYTNKSLKKIVLPIDITIYARARIPFIADFALQVGAEIHVLAVHETDKPEIKARLNQYLKQTCDFLASKKINVTAETIQGHNITQSIIDYAQSVQADLIAIAIEQTENPANIFIGSYTQQMVNHSPIPVMSVRLTNIVKTDE